MELSRRDARPVDLLASRIAGDPLALPPAHMRQGVVAAVDAVALTLTLHLGGDLTDIPGVRHGASYSPVVGDSVMVLQQGPTLFVLDAVARP